MPSPRKWDRHRTIYSPFASNSRTAFVSLVVFAQALSFAACEAIAHSQKEPPPADPAAPRLAAPPSELLANHTPLGLSGDVGRSLGALAALSNATVALAAEAAEELGSLTTVRALPSESRAMHHGQRGEPRRHVQLQVQHDGRLNSAGEGAVAPAQDDSDLSAPPPAQSLVRTERAEKSPQSRSPDMDATALAHFVAALLMPVVVLVVGINAWVYYDQAQCDTSPQHWAENRLTDQVATIDQLRKT